MENVYCGLQESLKVLNHIPLLLLRIVLPTVHSEHPQVSGAAGWVFMHKRMDVCVDSENTHLCVNIPGVVFTLAFLCNCSIQGASAQSRPWDLVCT